MVKKKVCVECGIAFVPMARNQITCSKECSLKRKRAVQRRLNEEYREKMKVETFRRKPGRSLAETARLARAAGMSYGQYMARMRMS